MKTLFQLLIGQWYWILLLIYPLSIKVLSYMFTLTSLHLPWCMHLHAFLMSYLNKKKPPKKCLNSTSTVTYIILKNGLCSITDKIWHGKVNKKCDEVFFIHTVLCSDDLIQEILECDVYINIWNQSEQTIWKQIIL